MSSILGKGDGVVGSIGRRKRQADKILYTENQAVAAAFATLGFGLQIKCIHEVWNGSGDGDRYAFNINRYAEVPSPIAGSNETVTLDANLLMKLIREDKLEDMDPEHPLLYAVQAIRNYLNISEALKTQRKIFRIGREGTKRFALIQEGNTESFDALLEYSKRSGGGEKPLL